MLGLERADLEIEGDQRFQKAVIEQQINEIFLLAQRDAMLATDEAKAVASYIVSSKP